MEEDENDENLNRVQYQRPFTSADELDNRRVPNLAEEAEDEFKNTLQENADDMEFHSEEPELARNNMDSSISSHFEQDSVELNPASRETCV